MTVDLVFATDGEPLAVGDLLRAATFLDDARVPDSAQVVAECDDQSRVITLRVRFEYLPKPTEPVDF
jgi:hypothetical protein